MKTENLTNRIVCLGANEESLHVLKSLHQHNLPIVGIITSKPSEQRKGSDYKDLRPFAMQQQIPLIEANDVNVDSVKQALIDWRTDYLFILGWSQIVSDKIIAAVNKAVIGSHPTVLPYGAGRAPIPWSILEGINRSAVSFFQVTSAVDAGDIYLQKHFEVNELCNARQLYDLVKQNLADGFVEIYKSIMNDELTAKTHLKSDRFIRARRQFEDGFIDFNQTAESIDRLIRALTDPYPGAFSFYADAQVTIWKSALAESVIHKGVPGQILKKEKQRLLIQCGDTALWLSEFSNENGDPMPIMDFRLGNKFGVNPSIEVIELKKRIKQLEDLIKDGFSKK